MLLIHVNPYWYSDVVDLRPQDLNFEFKWKYNVFNLCGSQNFLIDKLNCTYSILLVVVYRVLLISYNH